MVVVVLVPIIAVDAGPSAPVARGAGGESSAPGGS